MTDDQIREALSIWASELGREHVGACVPVLRVADSLGLKVVIRFHPKIGRRDARVQLESNPPVIELFRFASRHGTRHMDPEQEYLLRPRERFSVAHEVGHWLAFARLGVRPAREGSAYWKQEELANEFANALLVQDELVEGWLRSIVGERRVGVHLLAAWSREAKVSMEAASTAICRRQSGLGFLKLRPGRSAKGETVWVVKFSTSRGIDLPRVHTHVAGPHLDRFFDLSQGERELGNLRLGSHEIRNVAIAWWQQRAPSASTRDTPYWLTCQALEPNSQLSLGF